MPEETATEEVDTRTPMERAIAGGYKPEEPMSLKDRAMRLVAALEHCRMHNAPVAPEHIHELKDLLGMKDHPAEQAQGEQTKDAPRDPAAA